MTMPLARALAMVAKVYRELCPSVKRRMGSDVGVSFRVGYITERRCSCFQVAKLGFLEHLVGLSSKWPGMMATNLHNCKIGHLPPNHHDR